MLRWMYRHGKGVKRDYRKALYWYRKSHAAGRREALNNLAVMYFNGWGVPKDKRRAAAYYLAAADDRWNVAAMLTRQSVEDIFSFSRRGAYFCRRGRRTDAGRD